MNPFASRPACSLAPRIPTCLAAADICATLTHLEAAALPMNSIFKKLEASPLLARVVPFAIFVALTFCQGKFGQASRYWFYFAKTSAGAWLICLMRPLGAGSQGQLS